MKSIVNRIMVVALVGALASVVALAKTQKSKVTFDSDVKLNNTVIKKGTYEVKFDDETNQLSILKNGKVVAQSMARVEARTKKANDFQVRSSSGDDAQLLGVTFSGSDKDIVVSNSASPNTGSN